MRLRFSLTLLLLALLACALPATVQPPGGGETELQTRVAATLTALAVNPTATPAPPTVTPAPAVTPTPAAPPVLPFPLYFLANRTGSVQVWRLETDGRALTQFTNESAPVTGFDVSAADGALAFISGNQLILADRNVGARRILVAGATLPATPDESNRSQQLSRPVWTPDGTQLAYALNGISLISAASGAIGPLIANVLSPADNPANILLYRPKLWSPDGSNLLSEVSNYEGGGLAILPASGGPPVTTSLPDAMVCCYPAWSNDSSAVFLANDTVGLLSPGMWRLDANSGAGVTLIPGTVGSTFTFVGWPKQAPDGRLPYFFGQSSAIPESGYWPLNLYASTADGVSGRPHLRTDSYIHREALWSPDASLAVVNDISAVASSSSGNPWIGPLRRLKTDNSPAVTLADGGRNLRWGR